MTPRFRCAPGGWAPLFLDGRVTSRPFEAPLAKPTPWAAPGWPAFPEWKLVSSDSPYRRLTRAKGWPAARSAVGDRWASPETTRRRLGPRYSRVIDSDA